MTNGPGGLRVGAFARVDVGLAACLLALVAVFDAPSRAEPVVSVAIPVPLGPIYPGGAIGDEQLVDKKFRAGITRMAVHQTREGVVGKVARRVLLPGQPIPLSALKDAELVTPGHVVTVMYRSEGLEITARAMPLQPGKLGDVVTCRNVESGALFRAQVFAEGVVHVGGY